MGTYSVRHFVAVELRQREAMDLRKKKTENGGYTIEKYRGSTRALVDQQSEKTL